MGLSFHITIDTTGSFGPYENGSFSGRAQATLNLTGNVDLSQFYYPTFFISEVKSLSSDGTSSDTTTTSSLTSFTFFVPYNADVYLNMDATLQADAYSNLGDGQTLIDAGNTALTYISTDDPDAYYTDGSSTVFANGPETPEPASLALLMIGALPMLARSRGTNKSEIPLNSSRPH